MSNQAGKQNKEQSAFLSINAATDSLANQFRVYALDYWVI